MTTARRKPQPKGWYTVSVETLKGWGIFLGTHIGRVSRRVFVFWRLG